MSWEGFFFVFALSSSVAWTWWYADFAMSSSVAWTWWYPYCKSSFENMLPPKSSTRRSFINEIGELLFYHILVRRSIIHTTLPAIIRLAHQNNKKVKGLQWQWPSTSIEYRCGQEFTAWWELIKVLWWSNDHRGGRFWGAMNILPNFSMSSLSGSSQEPDLMTSSQLYNCTAYVVPFSYNILPSHSLSNRSTDVNVTLWRIMDSLLHQNLGVHLRKSHSVGPKFLNLILLRIP